MNEPVVYYAAASLPTCVVMKHHGDFLLLNIQFLDRTGAAVKAKRVKREVASLAKYIFLTYNPLRRQQFEGEEQYFSRMLDNYVSAKRAGTIHGGVGYRVRC